MIDKDAEARSVDPHSRSNLHALPGGKVAVNLAFRLFDLLLHPSNFDIEVHLVRARVALQVGEFLLQLDDRFFKIQRRQFHERERLRKEFLNQESRKTERRSI